MDGVIVINKPKEMTSNDVVQIVRKTLNTRQVGHCGTLDPLATGVLPILVGKCTKISKYLVEHNKTYIAKIQLGKKTSTADSEGEVIDTKEIPELNEKLIKTILASFNGKQMQMPPIYSAIKKKGKKLYEYARSGEEVKIEPREIEIKEIKLLTYNKDEEIIEYEVTCSKGTYIRSLCEDIASKIKTVGYMSKLTRTRVDKFSIENAITIDKLIDLKADVPYISIEEIFNECKSLNIDKKDLERFLNGVNLSYAKEDGIYKVYCQEKFIGLGIVNKQKLKRDVIL